MHYYYSIFLLFSLSGLTYADYKYRLVLFPQPKKPLAIILSGLVFFLIWDSAGIALKVFSTNQEWVSGLHIFTPNMPFEEVLFLSLFLYNTALVWRLVCRRMS